MQNESQVLAGVALILTLFITYLMYSHPEIAKLDERMQKVENSIEMQNNHLLANNAMRQSEADIDTYYKGLFLKEAENFFIQIKDTDGGDAEIFWKLKDIYTAQLAIATSDEEKADLFWKIKDATANAENKENTSERKKSARWSLEKASAESATKNVLTAKENLSRKVSAKSTYNESKVWPSRNQFELSISRIDYTTNKNEPVSDLIIELLDRKANKVIATKIEKAISNPLSSPITSTTLDTTYFNLTENIIAFGVNITKIDKSKAKNKIITFNLYTAENNKIIKVIESLPILSYKAKLEGDCTTELSEMHRILIMDHKNKTNGYKNIILKTTIKTSNKQDINNSCTDYSQETNIERETLRYENGKYAIAKKLR